MSLDHQYKRGSLPEGFQSRYLGDDTESCPYDREDLETLARMMGINVDAMLEKIEEQKRLHELAWKKSKRKTKDQRASRPTGCIFLQEFEGRRLFLSTGNGYLVGYNDGTTESFDNISPALTGLACGNFKRRAVQ